MVSTSETGTCSQYFVGKQRPGWLTAGDEALLGQAMTHPRAAGGI